MEVTTLEVPGEVDNQPKCHTSKNRELVVIAAEEELQLGKLK
jgi:hypothetical protein